MFKVSYISQNQIPADQIQYFIKITEWSELEIRMEFVFKDPQFVSQGDFLDELKLKIRNPAFFISKETGQIIDLETGFSIDSISIPP